jgi:regulator of protease activity HflC (stomatin/prohibitin superfamily)
MKTRISFLAMAAFALLLTSCAVINPGEVGVKVKRGVMEKKVYPAGQVQLGANTRLIKVPIRTVNKEVKLNLPSKEGLNVSAEISILYHIQAEKVPQIIEEIGTNYEEVVILSIFRSAAADVCAKFYAKDMHSGMRSNIEEEIKAKMLINLEKQADGIELISVLMKRIQLPNGLASSIEQKLQAEQDAMRMEFIIQQAKLEAQRKIIEATAERDAQKILAEGLTPEIIKLRSIEAFSKLSQSNNSKVIITDGKTPLLINE